MSRPSSRLREVALCIFLTFASSQAQSSSSAAPTIATFTDQRTTVTYRPEFTVPASADVGQTLLPNIQDPEAVDVQSVCPGYLAGDVASNDLGFTATLTLAGKGCNIYGNDVETLNLTVEVQSADRMNVYITPAVVVSLILDFLYPMLSNLRKRYPKAFSLVLLMIQSVLCIS